MPRRSRDRSPSSRSSSERSQDRTVKVENLSRNVTEDHLSEIFRHYGRLEYIEYPMAEVRTGALLPLGHAFVTYLDSRDADDAVDYMDMGIIDGMVLKVTLVATRRPPAARRAARHASRSRSRERHARSPTRAKQHKRSRSRSRSR